MINTLLPLICIAGFALLAFDCSASRAASIGFTDGGKALLSGGVTYRPIDESGVFYYQDSHTIGCPMPDPGIDLKSALERNGYHGVIRCKLVDFVDCSGTDHGFTESGGSRVLKLGSDLYRVTAPAGKLGWFAYQLATNPRPGKPHLVVCQLINDRERYTTVTCNQAENTTWAAPYEGEEKYIPKNQEGNTWRCDVGAAVYTGREYYCDGAPYTFSMLFYPKSDRAKITISHRADEVEFDELNGAAVARIWMFDILDPLPPAISKPAKKFDKDERKVALYIPHPWFLYSQFGLPCRTREQRIQSMEETVRYLKFCGFNQLQLHIINGSDRATNAWYDSKLYPNLEGNIFEELLPIAEREGIEIVPIVAPLISPFNSKPADAPAEPNKHGWSKDSCLLDREGEDYTRAFGGPVPNPLRPEVQDWQLECFREILDRCAKSPAVPAVGFRVNGKIGLCFTGEQYNRCGQDGGYNEWMIDQFVKDTGIEVPKLEPTAYEYIKENCWDEWLQWRCVRTRDFWLKCRDFIRSYRADLKFIAACDLPSETPGYNIEWPSGEYTIRDLFRHHGYDPELFKNDEGVWIQRGMMVASDRYWYSSWFPYEKNAYAHKMFNYAPGVAESYDVPDSSSVELYHNYWEEDPHPDPQYGPVMRTATPVAYKHFFYEPAVYSLRKVNVDRIAFMGWERACAGHEHDIRRFARAFRAIPKGDPSDFRGKLDVLSNGPQVPEDELPYGYKKPEPDVLQAAWYGDKLTIINDTFCSRQLRVTLDRPIKKGESVIEHGSGNVIYTATADGIAQFTMNMSPFDLQVLSISSANSSETGNKVSEAAESATVTLTIAEAPEFIAAGSEAAFKLKLSNNARSTIKDVILNIRLPEGWKEKAGDARLVSSLAPGKSFIFPVTVSVDAGAAGDTGQMEVTASYTGAGGSPARLSAAVRAAFPVLVSQAMPIYWGAAGETLNAVVEVRNVSGDEVSGKLDIDLPGAWESVGVPGISLKAYESHNITIPLSIPNVAIPGRDVVRVRFDKAGEMSEAAPVVVDVALKCPKVSAAPVIDGRLQEWREEAIVIYKSLFRAAEGADSGTITSLSPKAWFGWDDEHLYLAVRVSDPDFQNPFANNEMWKGDSLQFGLDLYRMRPGPRGFFEYAFTAAEGGGTRVHLFRTTRNMEGAKADEQAFRVIVDNSGVNYEAALKWHDLGFEPRAGDVIGISLVVNNFNGDKRRAITFGGGLVDDKDPSRFLALRLEK